MVQQVFCFFLTLINTIFDINIDILIFVNVDY